LGLGYDSLDEDPSFIIAWMKIRIIIASVVDPWGSGWENSEQKKERAD